MLFETPTTLPLDMELLKMLIARNQDSTITDASKKKSLLIEPELVVDYAKSEIKGINFLNYVSNLHLSISIINCPAEEKATLLNQWMSFKGLCRIQELRDAALLYFDYPVTTDFLTKDEVLAAVTPEVREGWYTFIKAIPWTLPFFNTSYKDTEGQRLLDSGEIKCSDDVYLTGKTIGHVLAVEDFAEHAISTIKDLGVPTYLRYVMESQYFGGNTLLDIFTALNGGNGNPLLNFFMAFVECNLVDKIKTGTMGGLSEKPNAVSPGQADQDDMRAL